MERSVTGIKFLFDTFTFCKTSKRRNTTHIDTLFPIFPSSAAGHGHNSQPTCGGRWPAPPKNTRGWQPLHDAARPGAYEKPGDFVARKTWGSYGKTGSTRKKLWTFGETDWFFKISPNYRIFYGWIFGVLYLKTKQYIGIGKHV